MSLYLIRSKLNRTVVKVRRFSSSINQEDEYTSTPKYPQIQCLSMAAKYERKKASERDAIVPVKTVEEKQIKLNMPKYYGFKCNIVSPTDIPYNSLPYFQHITRTHLIVNEKLPEYYTSLNVDDVNLRSEMEEAIAIELEGYRKTHEIKKTELTAPELDDFISRSITRQVNRIITNRLASTYPHLRTAQLDLDPRIVAFWFAGGMEPPIYMRTNRERSVFLKDFKDDPIDRGQFYEGSPSLTLRSELPLLPIIPASEAENPELQVPHFEYDPRVLGAGITHKFISNIPCVWPGDSHQFGLVQYLKRGHLLDRAKTYFNVADDEAEAIHSQAIAASYAWLHAQANNVGFNTYNDVTYPMVTQTVITNGQKWSFYVYQLNTTAIYGKNSKENVKRNVCWATPEQKLFESVTSDGKVVGFNEDVMRTLLKFYVNAPEERLGENLRPYLGSQEKVAADYDDVQKRKWLEKEYKYMMSNRGRLKEFDEIYMWERIYKLHHNTRFMEKKLRFFELKKKPQQRRLDDRLAVYVPRPERPHLPRHKGRREPEFFP